MDLLTAALKACDCWKAYDRELFAKAYENAKRGIQTDTATGNQLDRLYQEGLRALQEVDRLRHGAQ